MKKYNNDQFVLNDKQTSLTVKWNNRLVVLLRPLNCFDKTMIELPENNICVELYVSTQLKDTYVLHYPTTQDTTCSSIFVCLDVMEGVDCDIQRLKSQLQFLVSDIKACSFEKPKSIVFYTEETFTDSMKNAIRSSLEWSYGSV